MCILSAVQRVKKMAKVANSTDSSRLAEVVDRILDNGIVIDAWLKVLLVGIELLAVEGYTQLMPNFRFPHRPVISKFSVSKERKSPWYSPGLLKKSAQALRNR
jgi:hypothetical protein